MSVLPRWLRSEWVQVALFILLLFAGRSTLADHYHVPSGSMEYTLMPGDRVVVNKTAYGIRIPFTKVDVIGTGRPEAGDIAVFDSPENGKLLIKRIVAVGGDFVELRDGLLWVDGKRLPTEMQLNLEHGGGPDIPKAQLPEGMVLAIGDHRGRSYDSRYFGLIPERELYGRAVAVYYSRDDGFGWEPL
jgi:signal peptidase I